MDIDEISEAIGAEPASVINDPEAEIETLLTDSRSLWAGEDTLFFALRSESRDGHRFIGDVYGRGVRNFVVEKLPDDMGAYPGANFLVVPSTLSALQELGACRREEVDGRIVVGITGSRGKTAVKEWLYGAIGWYLPTRRSPRSYNSQIGVPLSLWELDPFTDMGIIEAGISRAGEMERLARIIAPDIAVITNVGDEHAEGFASPEEHAREKMKLAAGAKIVVYPWDDALLRAAVPEGAERIGWSRTDPSADLYMPDGEEGFIVPGYEGEVRVPYAPGSPAMQNVCTVAAALHALIKRYGFPLQVPELIDRLPQVAETVRTRIDVSDGVNGCLVAHDPFTHDVANLRAPLDFMHARTSMASDKRRTVLILTDIEEPRNMEEDAYEQMGRMVRLAAVDRFIGIGPKMGEYRAYFPEDSLFFADVEAMLGAMSPSDFVDEFVMVKGAAAHPVHKIVEMLEARTHETVLEVNLDAITRNFNYFRSKLPATTGLIAMVKASGYGAGSLEIAKTLQAQGAAYLAVAVVDEGIDLRRAGITMPIMVMNPKVLNYRAMFSARLEPEIYCFDMLADVIREAEKCGIEEYPLHIKLDTGMHRMGFNTEELPELLRILNSTRAVRAATLFSHLATADCLDMDDYTELQLGVFERDTQTIMAGLPYAVKRHILNSAGILRFPEHHYDFARLGIGLYGVNTLPPECEEPLSCVSTLRTVVIAVKERKAGATIGYGRRGLLERDSVIATIPIGYADGMNRHFGRGAATVLIGGRECPTVGNICMDACMVDVTDVPGGVRPGDAVEIFGPEMPVQRLSDILGTIPYEILTSVSPRVKRVYYRE